MHRPALLALIGLQLGTLAATAGIGPDEYRARRAAVAAAVGGDALVLLQAPPAQRRGGDVDWPARQEDNLYWLTGVDQPESALAMLPSEQPPVEILFARDRDPRTELWNGRIPEHEELATASGIAEIASIGRFEELFAAALEGRWWRDEELYRYYREPSFPRFGRAVDAGRATVWLLLEQRPAAGSTPALDLAAELRRRYPEVAIRDLTPVIEALREIKSPAEQALLQRAVDITGEAIEAAMGRLSSATHEHQVEATIDFTFRDRGACCAGYPSIVAAGRNATILHYVRGEDPIPHDGLLLLDVGAESQRYTADITRTLPVSGRFSEAQRAIYEVVLEAWRQALTEIRPGSSLRAMHLRAEQAVADGLLELGLVSEASRAQAKLYLPHGAGHPIGLFVHDSFDRSRALEPGMVVTLEPGVYVRPDDVRASEVYRALDEPARAGIDAALARYDGIGVRIEDDILVTAEGHQVLSDAIPRTIEAIEAAMARLRQPSTAEDETNP